jgi:hypothetical protein
MLRIKKNAAVGFTTFNVISDIEQAMFPPTQAQIDSWKVPITTSDLFLAAGRLRDKGFNCSEIGLPEALSCI